MKKMLIIVAATVVMTVCLLNFHAWHHYQITCRESVLTGIVLVLTMVGLGIVARRIEMRGCKKVNGEWIEETKS